MHYHEVRSRSSVWPVHAARMRVRCCLPVATEYLVDTRLQIPGCHQANTTGISSVLIKSSNYRATTHGISLVVARYLQSGINQVVVCG